MPSTNKTSNYQLNAWIGADKPQREDFNADNALIDAAVAAALALAQTAATTANTVTSAQATHAGTANIHLTSEQTQKITQSLKLTIGSYTGDGTSSRTITVSSSPVFLILFQKSEAPVVHMEGSGTIIHSGFCTASGSSYGINQTANGFTVAHSLTSNPTGKNPGLNQSGQTYIYIAFCV